MREETGGGGEGGRGRVTWQPLCGGAGSQGELITLPSLSVASFPRQTNRAGWEVVAWGGRGMGVAHPHLHHVQGGGRRPRLHGIPQQPRGDTEGRRRRNAEEANRKHMSASEKAPSAEKGGYCGMEVGGEGGMVGAHALLCTHTHEALCENKTLEEGDVGQVIYFWPQRGLPSETPGHSGQTEGRWRGEGGVASGRRRYSAIRMMKCFL